MIDDGQYIEQLSALGLDRLQSEPELLRLEELRHEQELQGMATSGYKAFIGSVECVSSVREATAAIDKSLGLLEASIPELVAACNDYSDQAAALVAERKTNRESLNNYAAMIEVLEVPQLMDTCVRNGLYDEAIELLTFTRSIGRIHANVPVVVQVVSEVEASAKTMVSQLHGLLRTPLQLHVCLRVVAHIRRLKLMSAAELRALFLECRSEWLQGELRILQMEQNIVTRLTKSADCIRTGVFEILTQFHTIFIEEAGHEPESISMVYQWAGDQVATLINELEHSLQRVNDSTLLRNLLDQFMHCAHSLGRVGLDFRLVVAPIFCGRILEMMQLNLDILPKHFATLLEQPPPSTPAPALHATTAQGPLSPPLTLLSSIPLSALTNYLLTCFNDLRQCAPVSLAPRIAILLHRALESAAELLMQEPLQARADMKMNRQLMAGTLLPYVETCFGALFELDNSPLSLAAAATADDFIGEMVLTNLSSERTNPPFSQGARPGVEHTSWACGVDPYLGPGVGPIVTTS